NYRSRKAAELAENPAAALVFRWEPLGRQVRVAGRVSKVTSTESDAYFRTRPRDSQLGAWASAQSEVVASRDVLEAQLAEATARGAGVLDVREPEEYAEAHIPGVVHIPLSQLGNRLQEIPSTRPLYVVCAVGARSLMAATALQNQAGIEAISVAGGTNAWIA